MTNDHKPRYLALWILTGSVLLSACASAPPRTAPLPENLARQATVLGDPYIRHWSDEAPSYIGEWYTASDDKLQQHFSGIIGQEHNYLALSGGGENGAFTAGLLAGWTASGTRPEFTMVTGISTGALIAPFAFLGSEYDAAIKEVYTNYSEQDLIKKRKLRNVVHNDALAESTPMKAVIDRFMTDEVMAKIAIEHGKGRNLVLGTTNLDAGRPVMWHIGRIADSGHPDSLELIRRIMLASASIPVALPPVLFDVQANGQTYQEIHGDGGVTEQVFLYPLGVDWKIIEERLKLPKKPNVYIIRNGYLEPRWQTLDRKLLPIAGRTIGTLIRTQSIGDLYRMYIGSQRDGLNFHLAYIPASFVQAQDKSSGLNYMRELYQFGYSMAVKGYPWRTAPPKLDVTHTTPNIGE